MPDDERGGTPALEARAAVPDGPPKDGNEPRREDGAADGEGLPDIDDLGPDSDYRAFMAPGVPAELQTRALRKLWRSKPVFSIIDGLDDYCEDYTDAAMVVKGGVKTIYKIGRGFMADETKDDEADSSEAPGEASDRGNDEAGRDAGRVDGGETGQRSEGETCCDEAEPESVDGAATQVADRSATDRE